MLLENDEPTGNIEGIDADALLSEIEGGGNRDIPMSDPAQSAEPEKTPAEVASELAFMHGEKEIKIPLSDPKLKQWAQQGYDYSQKMAGFNQERQKWELERQEFEKKVSPYKTIDEYARQNPEWWKYVEDNWNKREQTSNPDASTQNIPDWVKQKLETADQFISEVKKERSEQRVKDEDKALTEDIQGLRKQYENLDWDTPDHSGHSLEKRVLKHALDNGIKSFKTAFRDYYHEHLIKLHEERGKEQIGKELQKRSKLGIIGQSPTPKKGINPAEGVKNKSYEDLLREAKEEAGVA